MTIGYDVPLFRIFAATIIAAGIAGAVIGAAEREFLPDSQDKAPACQANDSMNAVCKPPVP